MLDVLEIAKQAEALSGDEQLELAAILIQRVRHTTNAPKQPHRWLDAMGAAPYPLVGEDAQAWVTRTRSEDETAREEQWRRIP
jgi:hypothetical protein